MESPSFCDDVGIFLSEKQSASLRLIPLYGEICKSIGRESSPLSIHSAACVLHEEIYGVRLKKNYLSKPSFQSEMKTN